MEIFLIFGGIAALVAIISIVVWYCGSGKKRTEALKAFASSLNFSFSKKGSNSLIRSLDQFHLFSQGLVKKVSNVMNGHANDIDVTIMDYQYNVGGGWSQAREA